MEIEVVQDLARLRAIEPDWCALVRQTRGATPFQLPAWLLIWWKHFGSGTLRVFVFHEQGKVHGVVPCFLHEWQSRRQLTLIGTGITDYTEPHLPATDVPLLSAHLDRLSDWEVLDWQDLAADTPLHKLPGVEARPDVPCSELRFIGSFESFVAGLSKDLRRNCHRYADRARQFGSLALEVCDQADPALIEALINLHALRWQQRGESGMIAANHSEAFLRDIASAFARIGMLRIFSVRFCGEVVAIVLGFLYDNRIFGYMSAFDPQHENLGFGRTLLFESFRYAFAQGYTAWNFLRGEESYKLSWGAVLIPKTRLYKAR